MITNFYKYMHEYKHMYDSEKDYHEVYMQIHNLLKRFLDINLAHLKIIYGG